MSKQEPKNPLLQGEQHQCDYSDQLGSVLTLSTCQKSINETSQSSQIKSTQQAIPWSQTHEERKKALIQMFHQKQKQVSESSKLKQAYEQIKRLKEIIESVRSDLGLYQTNSESLNKRNRSLIDQNQRLVKLNKEMNGRYDYFQQQLQLIISKNQQISLIQHQITAPKEVQTHQIQQIPLVIAGQAKQHIQNGQQPTETNQKMDILYESLKQLQTQFKNRTQQYASQSSSRHSQIVDLESKVKIFESANHQLTHRLAAMQAESNEHNQQLAHKQDIISSKDALIAQLRQQIDILCQANALLQQQSATLIINNYQSFQALKKQLKSQNSRLTAVISTINKEKQTLALQLLQQKENTFFQAQTNSQLQSQIEALQAKITQLDQALQSKYDQIGNIHTSYQDTLHQSIKYILDLTSINEQKCRTLAQETQQFYSSLILKKQQNWQQIKVMLNTQIELHQYMNHKNIQRETQTEARLANQIETNGKERQDVENKFRQLLLLSQTQILNLSKQLDRTRWQIQNCRQVQSQAKRQSQRYREALKRIEGYTSISDLIDKLSMVNERKELDGVILAFTSIQDLISNLREQHSQQQLSIDKQWAQIELLKSQITQKDKQIQLIRQATDQAGTQHQSKQDSLIQKCQQYKQQMQSLQHQLQQNQHSQGQLSQKYNQLERRYQQVLQCNQQLQQNLATIQAKQQDMDKGIQDHKDSQLSQLKDQVFKLHQTIDHLNQSVRKITQAQMHTKQENTKLGRTNARLTQENTSLKKIQQRLGRYQRMQREMESLVRQNQQLKSHLAQSKASEQSQMNSSYQQLYETARQQKDLIEAQLNELKAKYEKLRTHKQPSKDIINKPKQVKEQQSSHSLTLFFVMPSLIDTYPKGRELLISTIEKFAARQVQQIEMIFKMDDNNKATFHNTFKAADLNDGVYAYLFKKGNNAFGFLTICQKIKGSPSAIMFSLNNNICIFKDEQKYQTTAFKYDFNTIYFGNNEAKFKSGSKYFSASDGGGYRKYFAKYSKADIFGYDFKESLQIQHFQIHKVII